MKWIEPSVEYWPQTTYYQHIARVGRICYKSKGKAPNAFLTEEEREDFLQKRDKRLCNRFWESGHRSMFRHGSCYFFVNNEKKLHDIRVWSVLKASPYIDYTVKGIKVWISSNLQFLTENTELMDMLKPYIVTEQEFIEKALRYQFDDALWLLRMTLVVTTQRIQGESFNRKSPNCIAEQSTRYCNLEKKGGVLICRPHWEKHGKWYQRWVSHFGYWVAEKVYAFLLHTGLKPEDARGNLTFNTYTVCAYTYNMSEWHHIVDMRLRDTTGKAHPDAHIVAEKISEVINTHIRQYIKDFEI